jgi:Tetratricopeptide repeat
MNQPSRWIGPGIAMALLVPTVLTHAFTPDERLRLGLTCAPFGWRVVLIVHLVASVPIGLVTSAAIIRLGRRDDRWISTAAWTLVGLAGTAAVLLWGENAAGAFDWSGLEFLVRDVVRTIFAYLMVLPWLIISAGWDGPDTRIPVSGAGILVGTTLAFLPPLVYENQLVKSRSIELEAHLSTGRLLKAKSALVGLRELGDQRPIAGATPAQALGKLEATLARLERDASRELPTSSAPASRMERAFLLIQLDRLGEAERILRSLSETLPDSLLLLGAVYRDQSRWSDSEKAYRRALASFLPNAAKDHGARESSLTAYEGLAEAARSSGRPEVAERAYQEARRRLPLMAGYFNFQLGRHYLGGGRPAEAIALLRKAVRLDPTLEAQVRPLILQAQVRTPACLLRSFYR